MADIFDSLLEIPQYTSKSLIERLFADVEGVGLPEYSDDNYEAIINVSSVKVESYMYRAHTYKKSYMLGRFANTVVPRNLNQRFPNVHNRDAIPEVIYAATYFGIAELLGFRGEVSIQDLDSNTITQTQAGKYARLALNLLHNIKRDMRIRQQMNVGSVQLAVPDGLINLTGFETDSFGEQSYTYRGSKGVNAFVAGAGDQRMTNLLYNPQFLVLDNPQGWDFLNANLDVASISDTLLAKDYFPPKQNFSASLILDTNKASADNIYITDRNSISRIVPTGTKFQVTHYPFIEIQKRGIYHAEFNLKILNNGLTEDTPFDLIILSVKEGEGIPQKTTIATGTLKNVKDSIVALTGSFVAHEGSQDVLANRLPEGHTHFQAYAVSQTSLTGLPKIELLSPSIAFEPAPTEQQVSSGQGYAYY